MNPVDWKTALDGVDPTTILLPIAVLTLPCVALAWGLKKIRPPKRGGRPMPPAAAPAGRRTPAAAAAAAAGSPGGKKTKLLRRGLLSRLWARIVAFLTVAAWAGAGLGLVPLGLVIFRAVEHTNKWTPLLVAVGLVVLLGATILKMIKDLKDGTVDKPGLWAVAAPIVAVMFVVGPGLWNQAKDQAGQTAKMMFGQSSPGQHHDSGTHHKKPHSGHGSGK